MLNKSHISLGVRVTLFLVLITSMLGLQPAKPVLAATIMVTNTNPSGPGSLASAIYNAQITDTTVTFDPALAGETITLNAQINLLTLHNLVIDGSGLNPPVIVSGGNTSGILKINGLATVSISNVVFTGGVSSTGGAIEIDGSTEFTLENCHFYQNQASSSGGAISVAGNSSITIINSTFQENWASGSGGAISVGTSSPTIITGSTFSGNSAGGDGGAISGIDITLINSTLSDNVAGSDGGAISALRLEIINTTINRNQAVFGGGAIAIAGNSLGKIVNSTLTQNQANDSGGAISVHGNVYIEVFNSTFAQNNAPEGSEVSSIGTGGLALSNTILACIPGNNGCIYAPFGSIGGPNSIIGTGALQSFGLAELADNGGPTQTMAILPESPLIDAGNDSICANSDVNNLDQRGVPRPQGSHCDIGAYEDQSLIRFVKQDATGTNDGSSWSNAHTDLQSALGAASPDEEIWVAAGTYKPTSGTDRTISFTLKNGVAVYGGFAGTETSRDQRNYETNVTVLSGDIGVEGDDSDNSYHVVVGSNTNNSAILDGFTVTEGKASDILDFSPESRGGGMYSYLGSPTVSNVVFSGNSAALGGGMYNGGNFIHPESGPHPVLINVIFQNNSAAEGGGLFNEDYVHATLTDVTFDGNRATRAGAGLEDRRGTLSLTNVEFKNNVSEGAAGGIQIFSLNASLTNVTFSGNSAVFGGGIISANVDPVLTNVTFDGNSAEAGGGMWISDSSPSLKDVVFTGNTAVDTGGGMYNEEGSNPVLTNVTFTENSAGSGSGIFNTNSSPNLLNVTFDGNVGLAESRGGAMVNDLNSSPSLTNVTFVNNSVAFVGGAMLNAYSSNPTLVNVTFIGNSSSNGGGAIYNWQSSPVLKNVTIHDNSSVAGGAIYNAENSNPIIVNSILYGNVGGEILNSSGVASVTYSIVQGGYPGTENLDQDPLLGPLQNNGGFTQTLAVGAGSLAIDAGDDANCPATDQRGVTRPQGLGCDIGAYEVEEYTVTISGNAGAAGVTLGYIDGTPRAVTSAGNGSYTISVPAGWSGIVTPSKPGYTFTPVSRSYSNLQSDQTGQNYTAQSTTGGADTTGVFRPSNGALYLKNSNTSGFADVQINYGLAGDYPVVGDWDGDGDVTIGIYRNGSFYLRNSNTIGFADIVFPFGAPGDQPIAGDWNNDGIDTIGVYRSSNGTFFLRNSNTIGFADIVFALGIPGDVGIAGDWNGDGIDTTGVFRPSNGALYLKNTNATGFADIQINYGLPGDRPVTGDWNNDGIDTIGIYRNGTFYLRNSNTIGFADIVFALGIPGDHPIAGNWDGLP